MALFNPNSACGFGGFGECVALLLVAGADVHSTNHRGLSCYQELKGDAIVAYKIFTSVGRAGIVKRYPSALKIPVPKVPSRKYHSF